MYDMRHVGSGGRYCAHRCARLLWDPCLVGDDGCESLRLRLAWDVAQNPFRLSSRMVTGPWFTRATSIMARKTPSAT